MSGVAVLRYLLANAAAVTAIVPAIRIKAGDLPQNTILPAIEVKQVSGVPYRTLRPNETPRRHVDRVQVTWLFQGASNAPSGVAQPSAYANAQAMAKLVVAACPSQRGTINGVACEGIALDVEGPDLSDAAVDFYSGSRDFLVSFTTA